MAPKSQKPKQETDQKQKKDAEKPAKAPKQAESSGDDKKKHPKKDEAQKTQSKEVKAKPAAVAAQKSGVAGVFIRHLDFPGMNIDTIKETLSAYPKITEVRLRHGKYVLIFFETLQTAQKCASDLNGKTLKGNKITVELVKRAKPTANRADYCTTVFVGNLGGRTTRSQLYKHFSSCGKIIKIRVHNPSLHCFVYFENNAAARKAVAMADLPFSYGKDCATENPPQQARFKLDIRYSIRTKEYDKKRSEKRFSRAPPSRIKEREEKNAARAKKRAALKKQKEKKESSTKKQPVAVAKPAKEETKGTTTQAEAKKPEGKKPEGKKPEGKKPEGKKPEGKPSTGGKGKQPAKPKK